LLTDSHGSQSVAVGVGALQTQDNGTTATSFFNTAVGFNAGLSVTTGIRNTLIGGQAGDALSTGADNVAVGALALSADRFGAKSVAIGRGALKVQNYGSATDSNNTAVGYSAGETVTTGVNITLVGALAGDAITDGNNVTAVGKGALSANQRGDHIVAIGSLALENANPSGDVDVGNVAVGHEAGNKVTTGAGNTLIGNIAGNGGTTATQLTTGIRNTVIGAFATMNSASANDGQVLGNAVNGAGGFTTVGQAGNDIRAENGVATWNTVSDSRYKKDIADSTAGLSFINDLRPRIFKYKNLGDLPETFNAYEADSTVVFKNSTTNHGFIAQEIKTVIDNHSELKDGFKLWGERHDGGQEVGEAALIPMLVKAVQELSTALDAALARIATLEG